jgi:hypothetical protein
MGCGCNKKKTNSNYQSETIQSRTYQNQSRTYQNQSRTYQNQSRTYPTGSTSTRSTTPTSTYHSRTNTYQSRNYQPRTNTYQSRNYQPNTNTYQSTYTNNRLNKYKYANHDTNNYAANRDRNIKDYSQLDEEALKSWDRIHRLAARAVNKELKQDFIDYMNYVSKHHPCDKCRHHTKLRLVYHPIQNYLHLKDADGYDIGMSKWAWEFHNDTNIRLNKSSITWDQYISRYIKT